MEKFKFIKNKFWDELPKMSGVYCFARRSPKGRGGFDLLYIGKAINIRDRVKSHFQGKNWWERALLRQGLEGQIGFIKTNSEIEALILEANLIKKYQPKYNVMWRDDKNYFYVAIAQNENKVPYIFITHQPVNKLKIENCKLKIDYIGPFVEGAALKKTLRFLRRVFPYYTLRPGSGQAKIHPKVKCTYCHLGLCPGPGPDLKEYKKNIKKLILILLGKRRVVLNSLKKEMQKLSKENRFEEAAKIRDRIYNLQQVMAHTHIIDSAKIAATSDLAVILAKIVGAKKPIKRIECYDVSNIQGKQATGSMVVFTDGKPDKNEYRKFRIMTEGKPDDVAMLKETLMRRFNHDEWNFPDLILIDGGKAQLNMATRVKEQFHRIVPSVISIAKGRQELFIESRKKSVPLKSLPQEIYNLILQLDNEAHRFAIAYHRKLHLIQTLL